VAKQIVKIEGLSELEEALSELSKATGRNVLKRALINAAQPIADAAAANARKLTGKLQGSFGVSDKLSRRQKAQNIKGSDVEVYAGPGALTQAITEEFGTHNQAPHPTLRPAWDSGWRGALDSIRDSLADEIEKAHARAARKAARIAAKMGVKV